MMRIWTLILAFIALSLSFPVSSHAQQAVTPDLDLFNYKPSISPDVENILNSTNNDPETQALIDNFNKSVDAIQEQAKQRFGAQNTLTRNRTLMPDFTYLKPVQSDEIDRYFGYQSAGFLSGTEWKLTTSDQTKIPVISPVAGKAERIAETDAIGKTLKIFHIQGIETFFAHLDSLSVAEGDIIKPGQIIGFIDKDKFDTLYHELRINDVAVDPAEAVGLDFFDLESALLEDAKKAILKEARIENVIITGDSGQISFAQTAPGGSGSAPGGIPTNGELGLSSSPEQQYEISPTCNEVVHRHVVGLRQGLGDIRAQNAQNAYGQPQSIVDALCVDQLLANVVNFGNLFVGTNQAASQRQLDRAIRQIIKITDNHNNANFLGKTSALLVGLRDAAQAVLDSAVAAINTFITTTISTIVGFIFGPLADLGSQYNCQGIAAIWYTAENCFGLDVGGFIDAITLDRIELPQFGCVVETLASTYNPELYQELADVEANYNGVRTGAFNQTTNFGTVGGP